MQMKIYTIFVFIVTAALLLPFPLPAQGTWELVHPGFNGALTDLCFVDEWEGWVVDRFVFNTGLIYHTTDGGFTWEVQEDPSNQRLYSVFFLDHKTGWAGGSDGDILHTIDGGEEWILQDAGCEHVVERIFFLNENLGWAVGGDLSPTDYRFIVATQDGGDNWETQMYGSSIGGGSFHCVAFADSNIGIAGGRINQIFRTENGGEDWYPIPTDSIICLMFGISYLGNGVFCGVGLAVDNNYNDTLASVKSDDYGLTWRRTVIDTLYDDNSFYDVSFADSLYGLAVAGDGMTFRTENGGETWQYIESISNYSILSVSHPKPYVGWTNESYGGIYRYLDTSLTPPIDIENLCITIIDSIVSLNWEQISEDILGNTISNVEYQIHRSDFPYFIPDSLTLMEIVSDTVYIDSTVNVYSDDNYFYRIVCAR